MGNMKNRHVYSTIFTVLLLGIAFMLNDYSESVSIQEANRNTINSNITNMDKITQEFRDKVDELSNIAKSDGGWAYSQTDYNVKNNTCDYTLYMNGQLFTSTEEILNSNEKKYSDINSVTL
jgi:hypothetical protein